ncbi:glucose-6-phosphate dehydrogenase [Streptomyces sp. NPDC029674]|uniref:glucose-6-phosphate dehydrogenase n=1 Tax=Streptomyces sp. NPDC029674 TaxID=3365297 RepID=UPI00384DD1CF
MTNASADALVLFGATGDLARRKLWPALYRLSLSEQCVPLVVAVGLPGLGRAGFDKFVSTAVHDMCGPPDDTVMRRLLARACFVEGDATRHGTLEEVVRALRATARPVYFLGVPPPRTTATIAAMGAVRLPPGAVLVEKPFGRDLDSARLLNASLLKVFPADSVLRIDHYLGKEAVENLLAFRFCNPFLESVWDRRSISRVQITHCEVRGVDSRGSLYEEIGAVRDVVQSHLLQLVGIVAMERPADGTAEAFRERIADALARVRPVAAGHLVRGQYAGYRAEPGVAADSTVETFAALRLDLDAERWRGVPFLLRSGKGLAATAIEVVVDFVPSEHRLWFARQESRPARVRFRLGAHGGAVLTLNARGPGADPGPVPVDLGLDLRDVPAPHASGDSWEAYTHLLSDALQGRTGRFVSMRTVEESWRVVAPALDLRDAPLSYPRGSWGPRESAALLGEGGWCEPIP